MTDSDRLARIERVLRQLLRRVTALESRSFPPIHIHGTATPARPSARHSADYRSVHWFGQDFTFSPTQARAVEALWAAWEAGTPDLGQSAILEAAESDQKRLDHLFRDREGRLHPAWDVMIIRSSRGYYRLEEPGE